MIILITFASGKNIRDMIWNTDKRHAGDVPGTAATAAGTFDSCRTGDLFLTRRSGVFEKRIDIIKKKL
jgi:hypothetical protein